MRTSAITIAGILLTTLLAGCSSYTVEIEGVELDKSDVEAAETGHHPDCSYDRPDTQEYWCIQVACQLPRNAGLSFLQKGANAGGGGCIRHMALIACQNVEMTPDLRAAIRRQVATYCKAGRIIRLYKGEDITHEVLYLLGKSLLMEPVDREKAIKMLHLAEDLGSTNACAILTQELGEPDTSELVDEEDEYGHRLTKRLSKLYAAEKSLKNRNLSAAREYDAEVMEQRVAAKAERARQAQQAENRRQMLNQMFGNPTGTTFWGGGTQFVWDEHGDSALHTPSPIDVSTQKKWHYKNCKCSQCYCWGEKHPAKPRGPGTAGSAQGGTCGCVHLDK